MVKTPLLKNFYFAKKNILKDLVLYKISQTKVTDFVKCVQYVCNMQYAECNMQYARMHQNAIYKCKMQYAIYKDASKMQHKMQYEYATCNM